MRQDITEGNGYYVVYNSYEDLKNSSPKLIGKAYWKYSNGNSRHQKELNYLKERNGTITRMYSNKFLHRWYSSDKMKDKYPEYFI